MASDTQTLLLKFGEGRSSAFSEVIAPCLEAIVANLWAEVTDYSKEEFFRLGPLTDKKELGIPHEGGFYVQPGMVRSLINSFVASKAGSSVGLVKDWFPESSYCRTAATRNAATECAKGFRYALPVSEVVCRICFSNGFMLLSGYALVTVTRCYQLLPDVSSC
jgi:hypothetical protein